MGRPLNKKYMGEYIAGANLPPQPGPAILATAWFPTQNAAGLAYIDKQDNTTSYTFRSISNSAVTSGPCTLVNGAVAAAGQANVIVSPNGSSNVYAQVIKENTVTVFGGQEYSWTIYPNTLYDVTWAYINSR
jgi:hypothetical protein